MKIEKSFEQLSGKKVLVTGGHGFIGSVVVKKLCSINAIVHSVGRHVSESISTEIAHSADLRNFDATERLFRKLKPDIVIHLASHVVGSRSEEEVLPTFQSNLVSTVNLLLSAKSNYCQRVVLCGSLEEPDPSLEWEVPSSPYAASKLAAGAYGRMFSSLFDLPVVNLRVFMVFGPGQKDLKKLIPYTIRSIHENQAMTFTSGTRPVDWIYVDDVAEAFVSACIANDVDGKTIDVGSGKSTTVRQIVELIHKLMGVRSPPNFGGVSDRPMEQIRKANIEQSHKDLDWKPQWSLSEGLRRTIDWYTR